jgi:DNA-binding NtrC family response regulator
VSAQILIIDDEDLFREDLASLLRAEGFGCRTASTGEEGLRLAEQESPDIVLCDLVMPGMGGIQVVDRLSALCPQTSVLVLTAYGNMETAVEAFRRGAIDYLLKPPVPADLLQKLRRCMEHRRLRSEVSYLRREVSEASTGTRLIGESPQIAAVKKLIARVAGAGSTVLVTGESGTGKELVARAIHEAGRGPDSPLVAVNCAALPRELFESALFGHVRGAFTGASGDRPGYFEVADGGTLFLDEISELPLDLQPKLLRAIEQQEIARVGSTRPIKISGRIIAATNRDLKKEIDEDRFREDLYFRINIVEITLAPLRERRGDIPLLVGHLLNRLNARLKRRILGVDNEAMRVLMGANWRGNVRELENILERASLLAEGDYLGLRDFPPELAAAVHCPDLSDNLRTAVRSYEREHITQVLAAAGGNKEEAARRLGVNASTLYRRLKDLEIQEPESGAS